MKALFILLFPLGLVALGEPMLRAADEEKQTKRAREAIEDLGGRVRVDQPAGEKPYLAVAWRGGEAGDKDLVHLKSLNGLRELILDCPKVTDAGLVHVKGLAGLRELRLGGQRFTDKGLAHLERLTALKTLHVFTEQLTDDGLVHLKGLTGLEKLVLYSPEVTDAGLRHLKGLKRLKELDLGLRSKVTPEGVKELQKSLPDVLVTR